MRYCRSCEHLTAGKPLFCPSCGGSYDAKICPRGHVSSRSANVCGQCGATDLSVPQPRRRIPAAVGFTLVKFLFGAVLLVCTALYAVVYAMALLRDPSALLGLMLVGLGLGILWLVYVVIA
jgi:RNA polymerase subunit RPABC4/transcription elongation factor Spt4